MENTITIQKTFYKVADFISWKKKGGLLLSPFFQRRSVWKKGTKSFLMDTIYKKLPIPILFLRDRGIDKKTFEPIREVIDGQQRLRTIISFIAPELIDNFIADKDNFTVQKTHNKELADKSFAELDEDQQDRILNYEFNVHILSSEVDDRDVIQIFRRMNSTNYELNKQELRNAEFFGEFKTSQYNLAAEQLERWRSWKTFSEDDIARMQEVELTSELTAIMLERKIFGRASALITRYYEEKDEAYKERKEMENRFHYTMDFIYKNFSGNRNDFVFFKKTVFYTFFAACYDILFTIDSSPLTKATPKKVTPETITALKLKSDRIKNRVSPAEVLEATDRRTTNPREREALFNYLKVL